MTYGNGHGQPREPVERVVDLFVHMPIGLAVMAWKRFPELVGSMPELVGQAVSKGCAQLSGAEAKLTDEVRKARMIGQFAVTFGGRQLRREVDARLRDVRQAAGGMANFVPGAGPEGRDGGADGRGAPSVSPPDTPVDRASPSSPAAPATKARPAKAVAPPRPAKAKPATAAPNKPAKAAGATRAKAAGATRAKAAGATRAKAAGATRAKAAGATRRSAAPASSADLPIREYDGLSASQVVSRLSGLTPAELQAVRSYEERSRGRRTVLLAIDRLLG